MRQRRLKNEINVVPYIDVMLVLLVIFMVATPMMTTGSVDLPAAGTAPQKPDKFLRVQIDKDGALSLFDTSGQEQKLDSTQALRRALQAPIRQISENAGVEGSIVVGKILENNSPTFGFNAQTEQYVDLVADGVIDPAKVVRTALQDAASVSGLLITTEAAIVESPKKNAPAGGMPDMGGMGGMDF